MGAIGEEEAERRTYKTEMHRKAWERRGNFVGIERRGNFVGICSIPTGSDMQQRGNKKK